MKDNLIWFNKEGNQLNMKYDEVNDVNYTSLFFDKNSTDTYKTQGLYLFEKIDGTNNTFNISLNKFQVFNTNGFNIFPKFNTNEIAITNIELSNQDITYNTKWIYGENIEKYFYQNMWCYISGLDNFHNNDFDEFDINLQARKILAVEQGRVLIYTQTSNNINLPIFNISNSFIIPLNVIETIQTNTEPTYNDIDFTEIYKGKRLSLVTNTDNDNLYTVFERLNNYIKYKTTLLPNIFTPVSGDKLEINIKLKTANILITTGELIFNSVDNSITVPYIPSYLKVGDIIQPTEKQTSLFISNQATLIIVDIDKINNKLIVDQPIVDQTLDASIYLGTNVFNIVQDIVLDNNNVYSLPLTYFTIVNKYFNELLSINGGIKLIYDAPTDSLIIENSNTNNYTDIIINKIDINGNKTNYNISSVQLNVKPICVDEELLFRDEIEKDSTIYNREIFFTSIDNLGIKLNINGRNYSTPFNIDVETTISDFITTHSLLLSRIGIIITQNLNVLIIQSDFPNLFVVVETKLGDNSIYYSRYKTAIIENIKSQLLITINDIEYLVPFNTSDVITITNWVNTYKEQLKLLGIIIFNVGTTINFNTLDTTDVLDIEYNIGFLPKSGDLSIYENQIATNSVGSLISGSEIIAQPGLYNFLDNYSIGQKISINNASKLLQNRSYNIIGLSDNVISLSYQGSFWNELLLDLNIISDFFIRYPRKGLNGIDKKSKIVFSWKQTQINDMFMYDFSGLQLKSIDNFPNYNGPLPLCGENGEINLTLNDTPNTDVTEISNPIKQQTVFDEITYELEFIDGITNNLIEPNPLQVFTGYKGSFEGWNKARLYIDFIDDVSYKLTTDQNLTDDLWIFKDNYVELYSLTTMINFLTIGFEPGQKIEFNSVDTSIDEQTLGVLSNSGKVFTIKEVFPTKIIFNESVVDETSVKSVITNTLPYLDINNEPIYINRILEVTMQVLPQTIAYFDFFGESEQEDERHKISLNNKNLNILKLQDYYIFKDVDIKEEGIDWVIMNKKRQELLEIYPELFNSIASYKSVIQAINFFGYNDLTFTEYFQSVNPESAKFGQIFNLELLNILNKTVDGYTYSNLGIENFRNAGYRKTNLFSLNYRVTDDQGNFVDAYSMDEVKIKLLNLKKWLNENIIPLGTKIIDINGKYQMPHDFTIQHESYMSKNFRVVEYAYPVDFKINGYRHILDNGSNNYDIRVEFMQNQEYNQDIWYEYVIRTFSILQWSEIAYNINSFVFFNDKLWKNTEVTTKEDKPSISTVWIETNIDQLPNVQILRESKFDLSPVSFTVNELIDPYFIVEVYWQSAYSTVKKITKAYVAPLLNKPNNTTNININNIIPFYDFNIDFNVDFLS